MRLLLAGAVSDGKTSFSAPDFVEKPMGSGGGGLKMTLRMIGLDTHDEHVLGHVVKVRNPLRRLSLQLPRGECGHRAKTSETAAQQAPACKLAVNAGYFNVHTNACIGTVYHPPPDSVVDHQSPAMPRARVHLLHLRLSSMGVGSLSQSPVEAGRRRAHERGEHDRARGFADRPRSH